LRFRAIFDKELDMQINGLQKRTFLLLLVFLLAPSASRSQKNSLPAPASTGESSSYPNTSAGLRELLEAMLAAAKSNNSPALTVLLKSTEIPNCDAWLHTMYDSDKADSWMSLCEAKSLGGNEKSFMKLLANLAKEEGQFITRKVNDNPEPGRGMEWGWLQAIKKPLDIYFASWKTAKEPEAEPIGYFMFIDGGFRWESTVQFVKPKFSRSTVVPAKLVKKVEPVYPSEAAAQHISGTVRVYFVIGADGVVYNAHAISGEGLSDDPSLRQAAEDAVRQWRYTPATIDGKAAESNAVTVNIVFTPAN
jgi:TonB family protein